MSAAPCHVTLFDNGGTLLHVSLNVVTFAVGSLSTDAYVRDGGSGNCTLP